MITAKRLHGCVVEDTDWSAERFVEIKSNPAFPRCFGSLRICPSRTGAGNPIEIASNFQSVISGLICATIARGVNFGPDLNFRLSVREISSFTFEPPTSITRILFFKGIASVL